MVFFQIFWSESGEMLCIATDESFFILKYSGDAVEAAKGNPDAVTEDGIEDAFEVRLFFLNPCCPGLLVIAAKLVSNCTDSICMIFIEPGFGPL